MVDSKEQKVMNFEVEIIKGVNPYGKQLSHSEIADGVHRNCVGGMWDQIGSLQFDFMKNQGLMPHHNFLDVGCGCMRGGVHYVSYLEKANYFGLDINSSLIEAGKIELAKADLQEKSATLLVNDKFMFSLFGVKFEYAVALSVFTHLPMNHIIRCLSEMKKVLKENGEFCATYFQTDNSVFLEKLVHEPGGIVTNYDRDPFHYSTEEIELMAGLAGMKVEIVGRWDHPRDQRMAVFTV